jgi:hypothetical protein
LVVLCETNVLSLINQYLDNYYQIKIKLLQYCTVIRRGPNPASKHGPTLLLITHADACEPWGVGRWHVAVPIRNVHGHVALSSEHACARACRLAAHTSPWCGVVCAARLARLMIPRDPHKGRMTGSTYVLHLFYPLPLRSVYRAAIFSNQTCV